ncbi:hypothetical protein HN784_01640 [bacterium]|nr:hypothetical protein [bacterium]MBT7037390.1 hypothetical protein [bacterium]MBT7431526.1 hypothetical protein [bacterium]
MSKKILGFIPGKTYSFDPLVESDCMLKNGTVEWIKASLSKGHCIAFDRKENIGTFVGIPKDKNVEYFFKTIFENGQHTIIEGEK